MRKNKEKLQLRDGDRFTLRGDTIASLIRGTLKAHKRTSLALRRRIADEVDAVLSSLVSDGSVLEKDGVFEVPPPVTDLTLPRVERELIRKIVKRLYRLSGLGSDALLTAAMDLTACHKYGCPLDLPKLLNAPDDVFLHDVRGISSHVNRATGHLMRFFEPKTALGEQERKPADV